MTIEQAAIRKAVASAIADAQACTDVGDPTRFPCEICERSDGCFTAADAAIEAYLNALATAGVVLVAMPVPGPREWRHAYRPHRKYPWFCADCGYPEHERLKHLRPGHDDRNTPVRPAASVALASPHLSAGESGDPYGYCPICGAPGVARERSPNGNTRCERGHEYPSRDAKTSPYPEAAPPPETDQVRELLRTAITIQDSDGMPLTAAKLEPLVKIITQFGRAAHQAGVRAGREEAATCALKQRCECGTIWNQACVTIAAAIRTLAYTQKL